MADELDGKVAIVTGGASGLGQAMVERFAAAGARVVIADVDPDGGRALAEALGASVAFHRTDVTSPDEVQAVVDFAAERFGGLHVMVNNAGIGSAMVRFLHDDLTDFHRVMDIDLYGVLLGSQRAARHMKAAGVAGSIINVSSTAGLDAGAALVTYRAAKAAVIHASRSIALDLAGYGIRVNCLVPGGIRTPMTASAFDVDAVRALTQPLNREGLPEDVAEAALFLASDRSAQITGVTLPIDGGTTAGPPATQLKLLMSKAREA
jgi:NAD(P)-dependent dehydrogenase (short-subunit alcohol dehydrogenase family)